MAFPKLFCRMSSASASRPTRATRNALKAARWALRSEASWLDCTLMDGWKGCGFFDTEREEEWIGMEFY
jgi:hypothetical protein